MWHCVYVSVDIFIVCGDHESVQWLAAPADAELVATRVYVAPPTAHRLALTTAADRARSGASPLRVRGHRGMRCATMSISHIDYSESRVGLFLLRPA
jgi:hypothetical protein